MSVELLESRGCKPHRFAIELERDLPEEQFRERGQIVGPLPKRRNLQDDRVDSEVEIGPECLLLDESVEVLVRGGDQADVDLALAHIAEAPEFLLLMLSDGLKCRERLRAVDRSAPWNIAGSETALPDARASWKR